MPIQKTRIRSLDLESEQALDRACERFEAELRSGSDPGIEGFLEEAGDSLHDPLLHEFVALEVEYRRRRGEQPPVEEYVRRFPEHAELVREAFADARSPRAELPATIGPYEVVRQIGEGGMGRVYEARQRSPQRRVALKVIRADFVSRPLLRRFQLEAEALARLQHPGIAHIYEAGSVPGGAGEGEQPFFAMEYIEGRTLVEHAQRERLDVRARIELAIALCDAMQYAHQRGVIHRDLKPSNVLVDAEGRPKIIDFGVARVADLERSTLQTGHGQLLGTIAYMSPEQILGDPTAVDSRTDVYALGGILFELLTGRRPLELTDRPITAAIRAVQEEEPLQLGALVPELRGDLEILVGKALAKHPDERYASASEFAADLRRHLLDEPIQARAPTAMYQIRKFSRRHRGLVSGFATAIVVLVLAVVLLYERGQREVALRLLATQAEGEARQLAERESALRQEAIDARRAAEERERQFGEINEFLRDLLLSTTPSALSDDEMVTLPDLLRWAVTQADGAFPDLPEVEAPVRSLLGSSLVQYGEFELGKAQLERAEELLEEGAALTDDQRGEIFEALASYSLGMEDLPVAEDYFRRALEAFDRAHEGPHAKKIACLLLSVGVPIHRRELDTARAIVAQGIAMARTLGDVDSLLAALTNLGAVETVAGHREAAEAAYTEAIEGCRSDGGRTAFGVAMVQIDYGVFLRQTGRPAEAVQQYEQALPTLVEVLGADHPNVASLENNLGRAYQYRSRQNGDAVDFDRALELHRSALAKRRAKLRVGHPRIAESLANLAEVLHYDLHRSAEAEPLFEEALAIDRAAYGKDARVAMRAENLADVHRSLGDVDGAIEDLEQAVEIYAELLDDSRSADHRHVLATLADLLLAQERFEDAEFAYTDLEDLILEHFPDETATLEKVAAAKERCRERLRSADGG